MQILGFIVSYLYILLKGKMAIVSKYGGEWIIIISCSLLVLLDMGSMMGIPPREAAQMVIIMHPFYLDLRNSPCLFLKLMHLKEKRQDQNLADIKVEKKLLNSHLFCK